MRARQRAVYRIFRGRFQQMIDYAATGRAPSPFSLIAKSRENRHALTEFIHHAARIITPRRYIIIGQSRFTLRRVRVRAVLVIRRLKPPRVMPRVASGASR